MMTWTDILHPLRMLRNIRNEWYERREARAIFHLLEELEPPADLEAPPDLPIKIMQQIEQLETNRGVLAKLRRLWQIALFGNPLR